MGKKKIIGLCLAVGLMVGVVGGSLAWFTDSDSVTNNFATQGDSSNNGIDIVEDFNDVEAGKMLPGNTVTKAVQVENKATYDQYIRVKLTKVWKDKDGNIIDEVGKTKLEDKFIELNFGENLGVESNKWTKNGDYYYYNSKVEEIDGTNGSGNDITNKLLESVTLSKDAGNIYKDLKFDVVVDAEGIQAENGAAQDAWGYTPGQQNR